MPNRFQDARCGDSPKRGLPRIFVCSPYRGDTARNTRNARRYCRFVCEHGGVPFAPHLLFTQFLDEERSEEREAGIEYGMNFMRACRELWCFGKPTLGMSMELSEARRMGIPVRFFDAKMREVYGDE